MGGDGEGETHGHAAAVALDGGVEEFFDFGEGNDLVEFGFDLVFAHAEDGAIEEDVLAAGEFRVEAGADFEEGGDTSIEGDASGGGFGDAGEELEEGGFACAIAANDANDFTGRDFEREVFDGPEFDRVGRIGGG